MIQRLLIIVLCLSLAGLAAACGRKSGLLTPVEAQKEAEKAGEPAPPLPPEPQKDRRFILDGLL